MDDAGNRDVIEAIVAEALGIETGDFESDDNFFDLGLDSLAAARVAQKIREHVSLALTLSVSDVYEAPTLDLLCERVSLQLSDL